MKDKLHTVTRFEVIDHREEAPKSGRALILYGNMTVQYVMQDDYKTMKVFLEDERQK